MAILESWFCGVWLNHNNTRLLIDHILAAALKASLRPSLCISPRVTSTLKAPGLSGGGGSGGRLVSGPPSRNTARLASGAHLGGACVGR